MATGNQTTLFVLGLGSFLCGPVTGIPGIVIGRKMATRGALGDFGYFLCWMFTILHGIAILIGFVAAITVPLWYRQPQAQPARSSPAPSSLLRTAASFRTVTTNMTLQQVTDKFGMYDRVRGSGISYYEYDFPDGSGVLLSPEWPFGSTNRIQAITFYQSTNEITLHP